MKNFKKYAAKDFKSFRLKKKQIKRLIDEYKRLCKKHKILGQHITLSGPISEKELATCSIGMIYSAMELFDKSKRGEINTMDSVTGEMYFPKDRPGFVPK